MKVRFAGKWYVALILLGAMGCRTKSITFNTDPAGADLTLRQMLNGSVVSTVSLGLSPLTKSLNFPEGVSYKVLASKPQFYDAEATLSFEPKEVTKVDLKLTRYLVSIPFTQYEPERVAQRPPLLRLRAKEVVTEAYLDSSERSSYVKNLAPLAVNKDAAALGALAVSPTEDIVAFQNVRESSPAVTHIVKEKETLDDIAEQYEVSADDLLKLNKIPRVKGKDKNTLTDGTILTISNPVYYADLWKQSVRGSSFAPVTDGRTLDLFPSFSPAGDSIAFSSTRLSPTRLDPYLSLWRIKVDGTGTAIGKITGSGAEDYRPSIGPDGRIAFTSLVPNAEKPQVWTVMPSGGELTQLPDGESPQISPDGRRIMFVRRHDGKSNARQIWTMGIDGADERQLTQNINYEIVDPRWSPDGRWIIFSSNEGVDARKIHNFDIWVMSTDGLKKMQITTNGSWDDSPAWDRTGQTIYFRSNRGGSWKIWRAELSL